MPDYSDQQLVEQTLAGDTQAFRHLVERHQSFVYRLAYRFTGTVGDAEDITQEAFIRLWRNLDRYKPEIRLTTWFYKIVTNLCLDFLRSRHNRTRTRTGDVDDHSNNIGGGFSADQPLLDQELLEAVKELTNALSPKQKAVFVLRDLEGVTMPEIADILSMDRGQVKSNLYYARKKLGDLIAKHYEIKKVTKA